MKLRNCEETAMLTENLRQAIQDVYVRFHLPADHVVCDSVTAAEFAEAVNEVLPPDECYSVTTINQALLYLRKRGGLPRLVR
jgi:hypothetical protein